MLGSLAAHFQTDAVWIALAATLGVTVALTAFAFQTRCDFTAWGGVLCALVVILFIVGLFFIILPVGRSAGLFLGPTS